jgi:hypothetical protein
VIRGHGAEEKKKDGCPAPCPREHRACAGATRAGAPRIVANRPNTPLPKNSCLKLRARGGRRFMSNAPGKRAAPSWLNLAQLGLYRDLRKLVYAKLEPFDRALVEATHLHKPLTLYEPFAAHCAMHGYFKLLRWARANGCRWNEGTFAAAADGGHLNVLQWLHEQGCPWSSDVCSNAAAVGHFDVHGTTASAPLLHVAVI